MELIVEVTVGNIASGKSTYARNKVMANPKSWVVTCKDDIRIFLKDKLGLDKNTKVSEEDVIEIQNKEILDALRANKNIIVADTNLNPVHIEKRFPELLKEFDNVKLVVNDSFLDVPVEECIRRNALRAETEIPDHVIYSFEKLAQKWRDKKKRQENKEVVGKYLSRYSSPEATQKKKAIIVDLDGTTAIINNRSPYEEEKCENDLPNIPVIKLLEMYFRFNIHHYNDPESSKTQIIFVSGRQEKARTQTLNWLKKYVWSLEEDFLLYMRPTGDCRKDTVIKEEIYRNHIESNYFVQFVIDDRKSVVDKWRELGLFCFDVNQTREDF